MNTRPNIGSDAPREFLQLWSRVAMWEPTPNTKDTISWSWEANGDFFVGIWLQVYGSRGNSGDRAAVEM